MLTFISSVSKRVLTRISSNKAVLSYQANTIWGFWFFLFSLVFKSNANASANKSLPLLSGRKGLRVVTMATVTASAGKPGNPI